MLKNVHFIGFFGIGGGWLDCWVLGVGFLFETLLRVRHEQNNLLFGFWVLGFRCWDALSRSLDMTNALFFGC